MGMMKAQYMDFLDQIGVDPEDDDLARYDAEVTRVFHQATEHKLKKFRDHKNDKIYNVNKEINRGER